MKTVTLPLDLFEELRDAAAEANPAVARIATDVTQAGGFTRLGVDGIGRARRQLVRLGSRRRVKSGAVCLALAQSAGPRSWKRLAAIGMSTILVAVALRQGLGTVDRVPSLL